MWLSLIQQESEWNEIMHMRLCCVMMVHFSRFFHITSGQSGHGGIHLKRICEKWVSVAVALMMRLEVLPVIVPDVDNSSPSVPEGTEGPKSK